MTTNNPIKKLLYITFLLLLPLGFAFGQVIVFQNGYIVENGGTAAKPVSIVLPNSSPTAVVPGTGWLISENEFDVFQWNIGAGTGSYVVPFGYSTAKYLPLTVDIGTGGVGSGVVKFSTYHTTADQYTGVTSLSGDPSDVGNDNPYILPGSPSNTDNSWNIADRFYIIDANTGYTTKPAPQNITFSYISGTANTEVGTPNTLVESRLMAQRYNSTTNTWSDWFGEGCTDAIVNNVGTVQTGPVPSIDMYRSWSLWDELNPLPLTTSFSGNICNGSKDGIISVNVSGGIAPYTYTWSGSASGNTTGTASGLSAGTYSISISDGHGCTSTTAVSITQPLTGIGTTISLIKNVTCSGDANGVVEINSATGGVAPYTYSWNNGVTSTTTSASNLAAGSYTITTTDNHGCLATMQAIVTQPNVLDAITTVSSNLICNGGANGVITSTPTGGTAPYTYSWNNGATTTNSSINNLSAGTYTVKVIDKNGCSETDVVSISQPDPVLISIASVTSVTCEKIVTAYANAAIGGTAPYTYSWSTVPAQTTLTATGLSAGTYTITVTDNHGCHGEASVTITLPPQLDASSLAITDVHCYGEKDGSATCTPSGGSAPYSYSWFPSGGNGPTEGNLSAGTYTVTVTDRNGCSTTSAVVVTQPAAMIITTGRINATLKACNGSALIKTITGGTAPYTYLWSPGNETTETISGQCAGVYCCTITQANGCSQSICDTIITVNPAGIDNINGGSYDISIYPNPSTGQFTISGLERGMLVEIYDYIGRRISNVEAGDETIQLNIANEADGIYLIRIITKDGALVKTSKLIKTR